MHVSYETEKHTHTHTRTHWVLVRRVVWTGKGWGRCTQQDMDLRQFTLHTHTLMQTHCQGILTHLSCCSRGSEMAKRTHTHRIIDIIITHIHRRRKLAVTCCPAAQAGGSEAGPSHLSYSQEQSNPRHEWQEITHTHTHTRTHTPTEEDICKYSDKQNTHSDKAAALHATLAVYEKTST